MHEKNLIKNKKKLKVGKNVGIGLTEFVISGEGNSVESRKHKIKKAYFTFTFTFTFMKVKV